MDLSGPVSVFSNANELCGKAPYTIKVVSTSGGLIESGSSISVDTISAADINIKDENSILVVGGNHASIKAATTDRDIQSWLKRMCSQAHRFGSICSGAFILAAANLLNNKACTTHWLGADQLKAMHPMSKVKPESLYVIDGNLWTSAGVTTGIDMALEMVRRDLGNATMSEVAKRLVVYAHRPGNQSQFSSLLNLQSRSDSTFSDLLAWVDDKIDQSINVMQMADYMCMSERTFYRKFTAAFDITPSKYLEEIKLERAKKLLESALPVCQVAEAIGFKSESAFRARFEKRYGLTPAMHKRLHGELNQTHSEVL